MDISRLPAASLLRPPGTGYKSSTQAKPVDSIEPVAASRRSSRSRDDGERVVQGELLHRERMLYQSTRAYLDERSFEHALPGTRRGASTPQSRSAVYHYLSNARPETVADLAPGRSVNFFV